MCDCMTLLDQFVKLHGLNLPRLIEPLPILAKESLLFTFAIPGVRWGGHGRRSIFLLGKRTETHSFTWIGRPHRDETKTGGWDENRDGNEEGWRRDRANDDDEMMIYRMVQNNSRVFEFSWPLLSTNLGIPMHSHQPWWNIPVQT